MQNNRLQWPLLLLTTLGSSILTLAIVGGVLWIQNANAFMPNALTSTNIHIPYQGRLTDRDGNLLSGLQEMTFALYNVETGGQPLWIERHTGASNSVSVENGIFNVMLGRFTPLNTSIIINHSELYLGITIGDNSETSPRVQLGYSPFAVYALHVPDGSITAEKLANGVVTREKLAQNDFFRLLGEKTCDSACGTATEGSQSGWNIMKGADANDLIEVTVTTNGGTVLVAMNGRYETSASGGRWCGVGIYQNGERIQRIHMDGRFPGGRVTDWGCSGQYLLTNLPAGTYTFRAKAWTAEASIVTWLSQRQIAVFEF